VTGKIGEIRSTIEIKYADGACWIIRILGISEINHEIVYEVISVDPPLQVSSI